MTEQDKKELLAKIAKLCVSNNDTTAYGNGFEDAITLVEEVINTLPIHDVRHTLQPNQIAVDKKYFEEIEKFFNSYA